MTMTMERVGTKLEIPGFERFVRKNKFPDFLLIAGGEVYVADAKARVRVTVVDGAGKVLKKWNETVEYIDDVPIGNLFDASHQTSDTADYSSITPKVEIDTGGGFKELQPVGAEVIQPSAPQPGVAAMLGQYIQYKSDDGRASAIVGILLLA